MWVKHSPGHGLDHIPTLRHWTEAVDEESRFHRWNTAAVRSLEGEEAEEETGEGRRAGKEEDNKVSHVRDRDPGDSCC